MPPEALQQFVAGLFVLAAFAAAVTVEARLIRRIARDGGQVRTGEFRMPDALVALVLATFFIGLGISAAWRHSATGDAVKIEQIIPSSFVFVIIAVGVCGFLKYRGLRLIPLLGLDRVAPWRVAGWALGLVLVAFALSGAANALTFAALDGKTVQQPLVNLFRDVAQRNDCGAMTQILFAGVILAPVCEEFLFRGFFYAVGKRYLGPLASGFACALLFAAFHLSVTAFAGLFVLAVCLTLAYERTGSLLVPIGMHALFNFTSLCVVWCQARGLLPSP